MLFMLLNILPHFLLQKFFSYFLLKPRCVLWSEKYGRSMVGELAWGSKCRCTHQCQGNSKPPRPRLGPQVKNLGKQRSLKALLVLKSVGLWVGTAWQPRRTWLHKGSAVGLLWGFKSAAIFSVAVCGQGRNEGYRQGRGAERLTAGFGRPEPLGLYHLPFPTRKTGS